MMSSMGGAYTIDVARLRSQTSQGVVQDDFQANDRLCAQRYVKEDDEKSPKIHFEKRICPDAHFQIKTENKKQQSQR